MECWNGIPTSVHPKKEAICRKKHREKPAKIFISFNELPFFSDPINPSVYNLVFLAHGIKRESFFLAYLGINNMVQVGNNSYGTKGM